MSICPNSLPPSPIFVGSTTVGRERGHVDVLQNINAPSASLWNLLDFQSLALLAGASLTALYLASEQSYDERNVILSFEDLPLIVEAIQSGLPNLRLLHIALKGIGTAERNCKPYLLQDCLSVTGSLRNIHITTAHHTAFPFNALRVLAPLLACGGHLQFGPFRGNW